MDAVSLSETLSGPLQPLRAFLASQPDSVDLGHSVGAVHAPEIAPAMYRVEVWPGLSAAAIDDYDRRFGVSISGGYRELLRQVNGARLGDVWLYGIPPSMLGVRPALNRAQRQPLDIGAANRSWRNEFAPFSSEFHFGGVRWSHAENAALFEIGSKLLLVRRSGDVARIFSDYRSVVEFGLDSLKRA